ncbi:hypothetical protein EVAR_92823_1 [Eumeta japonica]|uniref:Uncharacterized protein n=1 Tax=Eumeta variegata TaxID=151549 RepID=A0A4C1TA11_EUMVA|nr:hypothetical protein EVAR_92823_1 [Eumeta japonica]
MIKNNITKQTEDDPRNITESPNERTNNKSLIRFPTQSITIKSVSIDQPFTIALQHFMTTEQDSSLQNVPEIDILVEQGRSTLASASVLVASPKAASSSDIPTLSNEDVTTIYIIAAWSRHNILRTPLRCQSVTARRGVHRPSDEPKRWRGYLKHNARMRSAMRPVSAAGVETNEYNRNN